MSKVTSYQKLKLQNQHLKQDIFNLIKKEFEIDGICTRAKYQMIFGVEDAIHTGNKETNSKRLLDGIADEMPETK